MGVKIYLLDCVFVRLHGAASILDSWLGTAYTAALLVGADRGGEIVVVGAELLGTVVAHPLAARTLAH